MSTPEFHIRMKGEDISTAKYYVDNVQVSSQEYSKRFYEWLGWLKWGKLFSGLGVTTPIEKVTEWNNREGWASFPKWGNE